MSDDGPFAVVPDALYTAAEVARYLRLGKKGRDRVYEIPTELLPKTRVGPKRGAVRYHGRDVLNYVRRVKDPREEPEIRAA